MFRWYVRQEIPGPWRISSCASHAPELRRHRFTDGGAVLEVAGIQRTARSCLLCEQPDFLTVIERCICETDVARCPVHQNIGCGG